MADKKIITDELLKLQTEKVLQVIADNVYQEEEYLEQEIDDMFDATPQEISYYESLINPDVVSENRLWSSKTIDEKLASAILEANKYTDQASTRNLTTEIVSSTADVTKENVLYLILSDASTNTYEQYMLIGGTATALGSTKVDLSNIYNKSEIDSKLDDKANKSEVLSVDKVLVSAGSEGADSGYSSKLTQDELDNKATATDVVDNLTSTDTGKPLSANQGKVLKDEVDLKANDDKVVKKTDISTTIDSSSTNNQVPSAKAIYNKSKNKITDLPNGTDIIAYADSISNETVADTVRIMNAPNSPYKAVGIGSDFYYTIYNITDDGYKRIVAYDIRKNDMYMIMKHSGTWGTWRKVCTTKVKDVPKTRIDLPNISSEFATGYIEFEVYNGVCYMAMFNLAFANTSTGNLLVNIPGIPKRKSDGWHTITNVTSLKPLVVNMGMNGGSIEFYTAREVGVSYYGTFSYLVAES